MLRGPHGRSFWGENVWCRNGRKRHCLGQERSDRSKSGQRLPICWSQGWMGIRSWRRRKGWLSPRSRHNLRGNLFVDAIFHQLTHATRNEQKRSIAESIAAVTSELDLQKPIVVENERNGFQAPRTTIKLQIILTFFSVKSSGVSEVC